MSEKKSWRDYSKYYNSEDESEESNDGKKAGSWRDYTSDKTGGGNASGGWQEYSKIDPASIVSSNVVNRVNSWLDSHKSYISDYQKRNSGRKYNYEDAYVSDSSDWLNTATQRKSELDAEAEAIISYLEQNKSYLDSSWAEKIKSTLSKARETNSQIVDYSTKDHEWWSGFGAEELVKQYGSAEDAYKYYQRDDGYRKKYSGLSSDELAGLIDSLDDGEEKEWLSSYKSGVYHDEMLKYDTGKATQELDTMEKVLQTYGTAARYYDMYQANPDAYNDSKYDFIREWVGVYEDYQQKFGSQKELEQEIQKSKRDLEYATKNQAIAELSSVAGNADFGEKSQYVNNVEYGLLGKPTFTDNTYAYVNNPVVEDKRPLGGGDVTARDLIEREHDAYNWDSPLRNRDSSYEREALASISEDEVKIYNYLYATEGAEKANEYLDLLVDTFKDRKNVQTAQMVSQFANEHPWIASALSVGTSLGSGFEYIEDAIEYGANKLVGNDAKFDTNESALVTNAVRNTVSEKVDWEIGNWDAFDFVYNTVMSGADSLASTAFGGWGGAVLGLSAAAQGTNDALERGMSSDQAFWNGLFSGVFEGLFETISIGQFNALKEVAPKNIKDIFKNLGKSMLVNASEETLTEIANIGYDTLVNGEFANYTLEELENGAWKQALQQVLEAGASGAFMGVGMGGISTGMGHVGGKIQANAELVKQYGDRTGDLIQEGLGNDTQSTSYKLAQKYQQKTEKGKTLSGQQIRKLLEANQDQITAKDMKLIQQAAEQRLTTLGQTEDVSKIAELATKFATGGKLSKEEKTFLTSSQYGSRVANELMPKNIESGDYSTDWAEGIGTKSVNALHYNIKNIVAEMTKVEDPAAYKSLESRVEAEEPAKVSNTGKAVIRATNEEVDLASPTFKQVGEDGVMLEANGKMVNANDIDYDSEEQGRAINSIGKIEHITPAAASALYAKLDMDKPVMAQLNGMDEAFTYGFYNYSEADLNAGLFVGNLTQEQKTDAYKLGQYVAKNTATEKADAMKKMRTAAEAKAVAKNATTTQAAEESSTAQQQKAKNMTITYNEGGGKVVDFDKAGVKLSSKQKAAPVMARVMHDMGLGTNFELFSSYLSKTLKDDKGRPVRVFLNDQGVEEIAYSGVYRKKDGTIRIDLNAYNGRQLTLNAMAHELTHFIQQWSTEKYEALAEFLVKTYEKTDMTMHERVLREQARLENTRKEKVSYDEAYDEVVANAMSKMLDDGKVMEKLTELQAKDASLAKKLWEGLKKLLDKFFRIYEKESALFYDADDLMDLKAEFEQLQQMWAEAFVEASENFQAAQAIGFEMDMDTESVSPAVMHSEHTWTESDYVQERNKAAQEIAKAIGVSVKKAKDYIDSINSIAKMIAEDRSRLDYFSSPGRSSFVDNSEYGGSFDFSTLCKKRRLLTGTFTAIQKALPNTALTADEILDIRNRMKEANLEVSCGLCYVEGSRANMGQFAKEFLRLYKQYYPDAWQPNMADVNTPDGIEWVRINHPECYEQYEYFWNHYGTLKEGDKNLFASQQKPKLYQLHTEYKGEILNKFKNDDKVEDKNINGGIRLQSFSDFEIVHLIDTMQIIMDMSRVGLAGQAYTKVPDFAWALGDTGLKINLSLIAKGVDADGRLIFDDVEGMPIADAMKLRDRYSKNVGTILVAFNDEQLLAAMADDRVDFIIPFHRSQWKKSQYGAMGLPAKTKDYTFMQNEKYIKPQFHEYRGRMVKDKATNYMPNEYWDFSKSGKENAEAYLEMCARNNKRPKFYKLLQNNGDGSYSLNADGSTDGYWKLLIDFKMYDNEGNGSPQLAVKPDFNMEEATRMLNDYSGGHSNFPVAQGIVDEFVKDYKKSHNGEQYSSQETDLDMDSEADYDGLEKEPIYALHQPGQDVREFDRALWKKKKAEAKQTYDLDDVESDGIDNYVAGKAYEWNAILRGDPSYERTEFIDFWIQQAINGLSKFPRFKGRTYRNLSFANKENLNLFLAAHQAGMDVNVNYFASSSKDPNGYVVSGSNIAHMVIDGFGGRDISDSYAIPSQQEVIHLPGTKLRITAVKTANDGHPLIYAQEVNENGKDLEANYGGNGQSTSGTDNERQERNAGRKRNDIRGVHRDGRMVGDSEPRNATVQRSGDYSKEVMYSAHDLPSVDLYDGKTPTRRELWDDISKIYLRIENLERELRKATRDGYVDSVNRIRGNLADVKERYIEYGEYLLKNYEKYSLDDIRRLAKPLRLTDSFDASREYTIDRFKKELSAMVKEYRKDIAEVMREEVKSTPREDRKLQMALKLLAARAGYDVSSFDGENDAGEDSREEDWLYDEKPPFSSHETDNISNRDLLANAFEGITQNSIEYTMIQEYKDHIKELNKLEAKLSDLNREIRKVRFTEGEYDSKKLHELEEEAKKVAQEINRHDWKLLNLEASEPLRKVIERERKKEAQKTKDHVKEIQQNKKVRAEQTELRHKIRNFKKKLEGKLLRPTDRQYVPVDLINAMVEVCSLIDTDTNLYNPDGSINKAQAKRDETKEKLRDLKDAYEKLKTHSDPIYAGEFDDMVYTYLTELRDKFSDKTLAEMTLDELSEMYEILRGIDETLMDARKLIGWGDAESVYDAGDSIVAEQDAITSNRKNGKRNAAQKGFDKIDNLGLSPVRNVERMSGYNQDSALLKLFKKFEHGVRKKNKFVMDSYKSFEHLTSGKAYDDAMYNEVGGKKYTDVNGREFGVSKMQMMQAILSFERETANKMSHIAGSGFSFADLDMLKKGNLRDAISEEYSHRVPSAVGMVAEFTEIIKDDKWCQDYMAAARTFFNETAKNAINETSIALKHRIIAKDKNYIPFEVDKNFVVREISAENDIQQTINSYGMMKDTVKGASQPLIITGLNNILDRHIDQVGNVYGLAIEVRNFNKVWNVRSKDEAGKNPTVKAAVERNWGKGGVKHIEQAVQDIQGPRIRDRNALYDKIKSNYIGATFLLNLSVVTKQIGSLFSSTAMLKWRDPGRMIGNLVYTMVNHKKIAAEVDQYTATAWMRRQGMSDAELYTLMTQAKKPGLSRLLNKAPAILNPTKWITAMDHAVALSLWRYAKQDTAKRTGLQGEALLKATAEFYDELVENTQSMTDVLHRPEIQKRGDPMSEALAMFKTDLYQMAGQLQATAGRFMADKSKENGKVLARTVYSIAMGALWGQLMTSVFALLRYKVARYWDDEDDELTVESWLKRQGFALVGDLMGYVFPIFGSEVVGAFENIMYGEADDVVDNIGLTAVNDLYSAMITLASSIADGEMPDAAAMRKFAAKALMVFTPIPANNILRTLDAIQLHAEDRANGEFFSFNAGADSKADKVYKAIIRGDDKKVAELKATYKTDASYHEAVRKGLRENDPRIHEAAQARYDGKTEEYKRIFREMRDEGIFTWSDIMGAVNAEENAIKNKLEPEKATSTYSASDFVQAVGMDDTKTASAAKDEIISTYVANGKTQEEAEKEFVSSVKSSARDAYSVDLLDDATAEKLLVEYADMDEDEAATRVSYWAFCKDNPKYAKEINESQYVKYTEFAEPAGIPVDVFVQYITGTRGLADIKDKWGDVELSKRDQVLAVIDSLPLTRKQKYALYYAEEYSESTSWDVPW